MWSEKKKLKTIKYIEVRVICELFCDNLIEGFNNLSYEDMEKFLVMFYEEHFLAAINDVSFGDAHLTIIGSFHFDESTSRFVYYENSRSIFNPNNRRCDFEAHEWPILPNLKKDFTESGDGIIKYLASHHRNAFAFMGPEYMEMDLEEFYRNIWIAFPG